ncbi:MAG: TOBE domain-containing protein, partial [Clostridia bacterium]|nr:TOBE domain-containing protein [Clostridia bacterium]
QEEALTMSDTIVVMKEGTIQQIGTPTDIYNEPKHAYVADFIGESNIIPGIMKEDCLVNIFNTDFECVDTGFEKNEAVDVVIRPEDIYILEPDKGKVTGIVESVIFKGVHYEMLIDSCGYKWLVHDTVKAEPGAEVSLFVKPFDIHIMKKS